MKLDKASMRNELRQWRRELDPAGRCIWDCDAAMRLLRSRAYTDADTLLCYLSGDEELSTTAIVAHAVSIGKRVAVPRWQDGIMEFCEFDDYRGLLTDGMGLLQPPLDARAITDIDRAICVVPALAATRQGYRLGYGGGYYNRFLAGFAGVSVALVYPPMLLPELPHQPHDIAVDYVITPHETILTNTRKETITSEY